MLHLVTQSCLTPWTVARQAPLSMGIFQARIMEWVVMPSSREISPTRIKPRSLTLQVDSLPSELPEKLNNTWVGSLSRLQGNLPNPGIEPGFPTLKVYSLPAELSGKVQENTRYCQICLLGVWCMYFKKFRGKKNTEISWPKSLKDKMAQ